MSDTLLASWFWSSSERITIQSLSTTMFVATDANWASDPKTTIMPHAAALPQPLPANIGAIHLKTGQELLASKLNVPSSSSWDRKWNVRATHKAHSATNEFWRIKEIRAAICQIVMDQLFRIMINFMYVIFVAVVVISYLSSVGFGQPNARWRNRRKRQRGKRLVRKSQAIAAILATIQSWTVRRQTTTFGRPTMKSNGWCTISRGFSSENRRRPFLFLSNRGRNVKYSDITTTQ